MTIEHKDIPNANLHEPKGVSSAVDGKVCHASSFVGSWEFPKQQVCLDIEDVTVAGDYYIPFRYASNILSISSCIDGAIGTADETITASIGGVAVTNGVITIAYSGSAAGDYDVATPSAANAVSAGGSLKLAVAGTSSGTIRAHVIVEYQRTA